MSSVSVSNLAFTLLIPPKRARAWFPSVMGSPGPPAFGDLASLILFAPYSRNRVHRLGGIRRDARGRRAKGDLAVQPLASTAHTRTTLRNCNNRCCWTYYGGG